MRSPFADRSRTGLKTPSAGLDAADSTGADSTAADQRTERLAESDGSLHDELARASGRRRRRLLAGAAFLLVAVAAGVLVALQSVSPARRNAATGVPAGQTTTAVTRRTLVEQSQVDGTLGYGSSLEVYDRLAGTFTWLPAVGAVIGRGGTLYRIDDQPIVLMYGSLPAYRALKQGISDGADVEQLNANLIALGFDPDGAIADEDSFGAATAAAVRRWQHAEGLPESGEVGLGRVVFAPDTRRVTAVKVALGDDPPPVGDKPSAKEEAKQKEAKEKQAKEREAKEQQDEKQAKEREAKEKEAKDSKHKKPPSANESSKEKSPEKESKEKEGNEKPAKESGSPSKEKEGSGAGAAAPQVVLTTTSNQQIVQLQVKATQQQLAHVGEAAPVTLPGGDVVQGHISSVGTVASESNENEKEKGGNNGNSSGGSGENATIAVTLTLDRPVARLDKAPVSVELVKEVHHNVLAVPATALIATGGGGYAIQAIEGTRRDEIAVTPGMFANGYVQIEGQGVREGLTVTEPE